MNEAEMKAQRDMARIFRVTNPFNFDFTHAWGGTPYTLPMGKPMLFPYPLADHLATHLARQALIRKAPTRDENEVDGKGKDRPLWSEEAIAELKKTIMVEEYTEEMKPALSESEVMSRKIADLQRSFEEMQAQMGVPAPAPAVDALAPIEPQEMQADPEAPADPAVVVAPAAPVIFKDKGEVIAELTKRGITFDARKSKIELQKLLADTK